MDGRCVIGALLAVSSVLCVASACACFKYSCGFHAWRLMTDVNVHKRCRSSVSCSLSDSFSLCITANALLQTRPSTAQRNIMHFLQAKAQSLRRQSSCLFLRALSADSHRARDLIEQADTRYLLDGEGKTSLAYIVPRCEAQRTRTQGSCDADGSVASEDSLDLAAECNELNGRQSMHTPRRSAYAYSCTNLNKSAAGADATRRNIPFAPQSGSRAGVCRLSTGLTRSISQLRPSPRGGFEVRFPDADFKQEAPHKSFSTRMPMSARLFTHDRSYFQRLSLAQSLRRMKAGHVTDISNPSRSASTSTRLDQSKSNAKLSTPLVAPRRRPLASDATEGTVLLSVQACQMASRPATQKMQTTLVTGRCKDDGLDAAAQQAACNTGISVVLPEGRFTEAKLEDLLAAKVNSGNWGEMQQITSARRKRISTENFDDQFHVATAREAEMELDAIVVSHAASAVMSC